jgi:hypothetical protein
LAKAQEMTTVIATFLSVITTLILGGGALIAYFQWRTSHQRVVLDLFDRRLAVFREIEASTRSILNAATRAEMADPFWRFIKAESDARFLFGMEVTAKLEEVHADVAAVMAFNEAADHQAIDRQHQALQNLATFIQRTAPVLFGPYIRLDQKMPSLWWPWRC